MSDVGLYVTVVSEMGIRKMMGHMEIKLKGKGSFHQTHTHLSDQSAIQKKKTNQMLEKITIMISKLKNRIYSK